MSRKSAYVGARDAELTIMVTQHDLVATVDLSIPRVPVFSLRVPFDHQPGGRTQMFDEMISALQVEMVKFLLAVQIPQELVDQTYHAMVKAVDAAGAGDHVKSDRSGVGGDPLLERVVEKEPLEVFEVRWRLPEGLSEAIHGRIVTAATQKVTLPLRGAHPGTFSKGHPPATLKQNYPSVRNIVQKFRGQQNKPVTGPVFVLIYDVQGRPVGVRSIKGPNWGWLTKPKSALLTRQAKMIQVPLNTPWRQAGPASLSVYLNPTRAELEGLRADDGSARALLSPDGRCLYAWGGEEAIHAEVVTALGHRGQDVGAWIPLTLWEDGEVQVTESSRRTHWHHDPQVAQVIRDASALQKAVGNPEVIRYYDESIVGDWAKLPAKPPSPVGAPDVL